MIYRIARKTLFPLVHCFIKSVDGLGRIPRSGSFIIAANHLGMFDPLFVGIPIVERTDQKLRFLVDPTKKFWRFVGRFTTWWTHALPVDHEHHEMFFAKMHEYIQAGDCLGFFPEGEIPHEPHLIRPKLGFVRVAHEAGVPIVPVGVQNTNQPLWKAMLRRIFTPEGISIQIGEPYTVPPETQPAEYQQIANTLMCEISRLSGIPYPS
jgi:1-acyl-sn-glycerol-3-phosphate acyltransferase